MEGHKTFIMTPIAMTSTTLSATPRYVVTNVATPIMTLFLKELKKCDCHYRTYDDPQGNIFGDLQGT